MNIRRTWTRCFHEARFDGDGAKVGMKIYHHKLRICRIFWIPNATTSSVYFWIRNHTSSSKMCWVYFAAAFLMMIQVPLRRGQAKSVWKSLDSLCHFAWNFVNITDGIRFGLTSTCGHPLVVGLGRIKTNSTGGSCLTLAGESSNFLAPWHHQNLKTPTKAKDVSRRREQILNYCWSSRQFLPPFSRHLHSDRKCNIKRRR